MKLLGTFGWGVGLACALSFPGCTGELEESGSNTNWYSTCDATSDCGGDLECVCGVCTTSCTSSCPEDGTCVRSGSSVERQLCASSLAASEGVAPLDGSSKDGMCLASCEESSDCGAAALCLDGACVQAGEADEDCPNDASIELDTGGAELVAREGLVFSDTLYVPVTYAEEPTDSVELGQPRRIVARVRDGDDAAVSGCRVHWFTARADGRVFPETDSSNDDGEIGALWVAGTNPSSRLEARIVRRSGKNARAELRGAVTRHDAPPQAEDVDVRAVNPLPQMLSLDYSLASAVDAVEVLVTPRTFPHRSFYVPISRGGFFSGLQNTSDVDAETDTVEPVDRLFIASIWNTAEAQALLLYSGANVSCGAHEQDEGGIRCALEDAWQKPGDEFVVRLELRSLAEGETDPSYADLGYLEDPCATVGGCTDYTVFFDRAENGAEPARFAAFRRPTAEQLGSFSSFIQPYSTNADETGCLDTQRHDALFSARSFVGVTPTQLAAATPNIGYTSWRDDMCSNYGYGANAESFWLASGGPFALSAPIVPGSERPRLELHDD